MEKCVCNPGVPGRSICMKRFFHKGDLAGMREYALQLGAQDVQEIPYGLRLCREKINISGKFPAVRNLPMATLDVGADDNTSNLFEKLSDRFKMSRKDAELFFPK